MASDAHKHPPKESERPQTEPYAPPEHPDVHVPDQQFEGDPKRDQGQRKDREERPR